MDNANEKLPNVSIIIPAYNEEKFIGETLKTIEKIKYLKDKYEVIVIDNGSKDRTYDIAKKYTNNVFCYPNGTTIAAVRNYGAKKAKGEIFAFIDADCIVTMDWMKNAVKGLTNKVGVIGSKPFTREYDSTWVQKIWSIIVPKSIDKPVKVEWLSTQNMILKRELFEKVGGFNEELETCEDVDICYRLSKISTILYDPSVKVYTLRDPKTLYELFLKEIWHGKSTYRGITGHGFRLREVFGSIVLLCYFINILIAFISIAINNTHLLILSLLIFLGLPAAVTYKCSSRIKEPKMLIQCFAVNITYIFARSISIVMSFKDLKKK